MLQKLLIWFGSIVILLAGLGLLEIVAFFLGDPTGTVEIGVLGSVQFVLNTNAAALSSAVAIIIALVLLTVQLTAQRYSFYVIGVFINNPINVGLIILFLVTITFNLWTALLLADERIPPYTVLMCMVLMTLCFALIPPYIRHLFDILRPEYLLNHLQRRFEKALPDSPLRTDLSRRRLEAVGRLSQVGDIARTAVTNGDSAVARHSVWVLYYCIERYLADKPKMPGQWFTVDVEPHFVGRHKLIVREIEETLTWTERRMLDELREIFTATLNRMHDVNHTVALVARMLAERGIEAGDDGLLRTVMKFFNTILRSTINQSDVRAGYHALYQYRLLADAAIDHYPDRALEIAERIHYYGDAAFGGPLLWMSAASAYDLRMLAEGWHQRGVPERQVNAAIRCLLELVRRAERRGSPAIMQLYKTVAATGAYFLSKSDYATAKRLRDALGSLDEAALSQLSSELSSVDDQVFWEFTDRVVNFDYVEPEVRAELPAFLGNSAAWASPPTAHDRPAAVVAD
jgi:hypothetical protein